MSSFAATHSGLSRVQLAGILVAVAVILVVLLPAALFAFWCRRIREQARALDGRQSELMELQEAGWPPAPVWEADASGVEGGRGANVSGTAGTARAAEMPAVRCS